MIRSSIIVVLSVGLAGCSSESRPPASAAPVVGSVVGNVVRLDPASDALLPKDAQIEKVAGGFTFIEGPLWRPNGVLWFSDVVGNVVRQWSPDGKVTELFRPGGYDGNSLPAGGFNGPNGMTRRERRDGAAVPAREPSHRGYRQGHEDDQPSGPFRREEAE